MSLQQKKQLSFKIWNSLNDMFHLPHIDSSILYSKWLIGCTFNLMLRVEPLCLNHLYNSQPVCHWSKLVAIWLVLKKNYDSIYFRSEFAEDESQAPVWERLERLLLHSDITLDDVQANIQHLMVSDTPSSALSLFPRPVRFSLFMFSNFFSRSKFRQP